MLPALGYVAWVESYDAFLDLSSGNKCKIKVPEIKSVLKVYPEILLAMFSKPGKL
jgi:hypothetical protein